MSRLLNLLIITLLSCTVSLAISAQTKVPSGQEYVDLFKLYIEKKNPQLKVLQAEHNYNLIHLAVVINDAKLIEAAMQSGIDINGKSKTGLTPLHIAVGLQSVPLTRILLNFGANVNSQEDKGVTPLHLAAGYGNQEIVKMLIQSHADVNAMDTHGATPIIFAQTEDHQQIKQLLIAAGAKARPTSVIEENKIGNVSIRLPADDPLINTQKQLAREQLPKFWQLAKRFPESASVKILITGSNGQKVPVWASVKKIHQDTLDVEVIAPPTDATKLQTIHKNQIDDWEVDLPNGKIRGQFSNQALLKAVHRELGYLPSGFQEVADTLMDYKC